MSKMIRTCTLAIAALGISVMLAGCMTGTTRTKTTITEFDEAGKVTRTTVTDADTESIVSSVMKATEDKSVMLWDNSFKAYLSISAGTVENPTPHFDGGIGKNDRGYISIHKNHDPSVGPRMIQAARAQEITLSPTGIETSSGDKATGANKENTDAQTSTGMEAKVGGTEGVDQDTVLPLLGIILPKDDGSTQNKEGSTANGGTSEQPKD